MKENNTKLNEQDLIWFLARLKVYTELAIMDYLYPKSPQLTFYFEIPLSSFFVDPAVNINIQQQ